GVVVGEVVDGNDLDVGGAERLLRLDRPEEVAPDAPESVHAYADSHNEAPLPSISDGRARVTFTLVGYGRTAGAALAWRELPCKPAPLCLVQQLSGDGRFRVGNAEFLRATIRHRQQAADPSCHGVLGHG